MCNRENQVNVYFMVLWLSKNSRDVFNLETILPEKLLGSFTLARKTPCISLCLFEYHSLVVLKYTFETCSKLCKNIAIYYISLVLIPPSISCQECFRGSSRLSGALTWFGHGKRRCYHGGSWEVLAPPAGNIRQNMGWLGEEMNGWFLDDGI